MLENSGLAGLACPACRSGLTSRGYASCGYLACGQCGVYFPYLHGFSYFDQPTLNPLDVSDEQSLDNSLVDQLPGDEGEYAAFLQGKSKRPSYDAYAAFQPFNESTRALYALLDEIRKHVQPGQVILDLWGRTAWSGEVLASYFPDNPVYMIWEGNRNVLGYRGYHYWLRESRCLENLHIVFSDLEKPLPFSDDFFGFVHGLDTLHRYSHSPLLSEVFRVARATAPIVFPHIHLTNSEPEPYFDRGCIQYHGSVYRKLFDRLGETQGRQFYLLSEKTLFENKSAVPLSDDWNMTHYNALLYIAPVGVETSHMNACAWPQQDLHEDSRLILNPLLKVDAISGIASIYREAMEGYGHEMLDRHPLYEDRLKACLPFTLNDAQRKIIFCVEQGLSLRDICELCKLSLEALKEQLLELQAREICTFENISASMAQLQRFYSTQTLLDEAYDRPSFSGLWRACQGQDAQWPVFISPAQDVEYTREDVQDIVETIRMRFVSADLQPGDRVLLCAQQHPEYLMTIWAAWLQGLTVVPVASDWGAESIECAIGKTKAKMVFLASESAIDDQLTVSPVYFDPLDESTLEENNGRRYFADWLDEMDDDVALSPVDESAYAAAILFTSGTTGAPKGVAHNFASLYRGSAKLTSHYQLDEQQSLLSFGEFHSMSGLRNAAVLGLFNKQTVILADSPGINAPRILLEACSDYAPNIVFSTPALIDAVAAMAGKLDNKDLSGLAVWLCTGASVSNSKLYELAKKFPMRFESYYGLTETGGFCTGTVLNENTETASIGIPAGAIFKLENAPGDSVANNAGALKVFSDQLMLGYIAEDGTIEEAAVDAGGWYDTGDLASVNSAGEIILQGRNDEQFKTPAGDCINLEHLEALVKDQYTAINFALTHSDNKIKLVVEVPPGKFTDDNYEKELSELLNHLRVISGVSLGDIDTLSVETIPVNKNGKIERHKIKNI